MPDTPGEDSPKPKVADLDKPFATLEVAEIRQSDVVRETSFYHPDDGSLQLRVIANTKYNNFSIVIPNGDGSKTCVQLPLSSAEDLVRGLLFG